tara:strand:- start:572 stop:1552 length:981 start_codon:yes stop_codon:yes gene_type:complete
MELEQYLTSRIKNKKSIKKLPKSKSFRQIARRGRGFGRARNVRHKDYKNSKDEINMKILQLLDKMLGKDEKVDRVMKQNEQEVKKPLLMLKEGKLEEDPQINIIENEQLAIEIGNHLRDYKTKWEHILDQQNDLIEGLGNVSEGKMGEQTLFEFQEANQKVKNEIIGLQFDLQKQLNEAKDVNAYKEFITFQNEVFTKAIPNFVEVDNRISSENKINIDNLQDYDISLQEREGDMENLLEDTLNDLKDASLQLKKSEKKEEALRINLKLDREKIKTLEEQKQLLEQSLMGTQDTDVPKRQILLDRYITRQQREEPEFTGEVVERDI